MWKKRIKKLNFHLPLIFLDGVTLKKYYPPQYNISFIRRKLNSKAVAQECSVRQLSWGIPKNSLERTSYRVVYLLVVQTFNFTVNNLTAVLLLYIYSEQAFYGALTSSCSSEVHFVWKVTWIMCRCTSNKVFDHFLWNIW